ncbi:hypothetical protein PV646_40750 [Streptomyces sp. ID05-26A]|nr:hypothetical protein [Streptomyces sp. ID05-26A]
MSARGEAVTEQIRLAMESSNPRDIVSGVKEAVANEVSSLSPDAKVVLTQYFNHTYMPDLVVEWQEAGKRDHRPIFIRNQLRPSTADEVRALATSEPMMVSIGPSLEPSGGAENVRRQALQEQRVLVTDVAALSEVATPAGFEESPGRAKEPLVRLVQTNLIKGGRGLLTLDDAALLIRGATPTADDDGISQQFLQSFQERTRDTFTFEAALRLNRAAELLHFGSSASDGLDAPESTGQMSDTELAVLLPYLLSDPTSIAKPALWTHIGSMMSLERLEAMANMLVGVNVSPLVVPNSTTWTAKRAQLVIDGEAGQDDDPSADAAVQADDAHDPPVWQVEGRKYITAKVGRWKVNVTSDARRLQGRIDGTAAHWDDIAALLSDFALDAVDLRGISRRIQVSAEESGDVSRDIGLIRGSLDDIFQVPKVKIRRIGDDQDASLDTDFGEMTVTATKAASIASVVTALNLLAHRWPADFSMLIGSQAPVETEPEPDDAG